STDRPRRRATRCDNLKRNGIGHSFHGLISGNKRGRPRWIAPFAGGPADLALLVRVSPVTLRPRLSTALLLQRFFYNSACQPRLTDWRSRLRSGSWSPE